MGNFLTKIVEKINTHNLYSYNLKKNGRARHATDDNIIWRMPIACWITKAKDTHSEYVILTAVHCKNGFTCALQYYVNMCIAFLVIN
jgi:hypothetical protein